MERFVISVVLSFLVVALGCDDGTRATKGSTPASPQAEIPLDVTYPTISVEENLPYTRTVGIQISRRVNENELKAIAEKIKGRYPSDCSRTFIYYLLSGEGASSWANTDFTPDLSVKINGGDRALEQRLMNEAREEPGITIGRWLDTGNGSGFLARLRIYAIGGQTFMEKDFGDGSKGVDRMIEIDSPEGKKFKYADKEIPDGAIMVIDMAGNLEFWNSVKLIYSVPPLK